MLALRQLAVLGAGAAVAQHAGAVDEALALGVAPHGQLQALHALERQLLQLLQAELTRRRARVHFGIARAGGARASLGLVLRVAARARLQLDGLGVAAQVARCHQHARVRHVAGRRRLHGRAGRRAHAGHHA